MWDYYYVIIVILVFLKVMFWTFYFYIRAQRVRSSRAQRRFVVVETRSVPIGYSDRSAIVQHEVLPDTRACPPGGFHPAPPAYEEVVQNTPNKPPSYEQAVSNYMPQENQPQPSQIPVAVAQTVPPNSGHHLNAQM